MAVGEYRGRPASFSRDHFKNYAADQSAGVVLAWAADDFSKETLQFYFASHGKESDIDATATIGKVGNQGTGTLNVISPTATFYNGQRHDWTQRSKNQRWPLCRSR